MRTTFVCLIAWLACSVTASAAVITQETADRGWYRGEGLHIPTNLNYITGTHTVTGAPSNSYRSFFVVDLTGFDLNTEILAAELNLQNPTFGMEPSGSTHTLAIFDVTTDLDDLTQGLGGVAAFNDLGTGTSYGTVVVSEPAVRFGAIIDIALNADAIAALNAARGGMIAFGGHILTLSGFGHEEIFSRTDEEHFTAITLTTAEIPEPSTVVLAALGLAGCLATKTCRRLARRHLSDPHC